MTFAPALNETQEFGIFFIGDNYPAERSQVDFYAELLDQVEYSVWFAEHHFHEQ